MNEDAAEMLESLKGKLRKGDRTVAARRVRETRPMTYAERREAGQYKSERTEQTNLKFTPAFKKRLIALSIAAGETLTEYIERAVDERSERGA